jgi:hypothetical protein
VPTLLYVDHGVRVAVEGSSFERVQITVQFETDHGRHVPP